jgi:hypothetical protein
LGERETILKKKIMKKPRGLSLSLSFDCFFPSLSTHLKKRRRRRALKEEEI